MLYSRRFHLLRHVDESGISGRGRVAEGVEFTTGHVVLNWLTEWGSLGVYPSLAHVIAIHGHNGATEIVWEDPE